MALTPANAWKPIDRYDWTDAKIRHLLRRIGYAALPHEVDLLREKTPEDAVDYLLERGQPFAEPRRMELYRIKEWETRAEYRESRDQYRYGDISAEERAEFEKRYRELSAERYKNKWNTWHDFLYSWLKFARKEENSAQEKLVQFVQNILVINRTEVGDLENGGGPPAHYEHQRALRSHLLGDYGSLCKAISRNPAMVKFLNLDTSKKGKPNENFARELFELFILGEGRGYTEEDIQEAARAFTGYSRAQRDYSFKFDAKQHDDGRKEVFGQRGKLTGDDVIDLAMEQDAAQTYIPILLCREFLREEPLPDAYMKSLGLSWKYAKFDLKALFRIFFTSQAFYHPASFGQVFKSPIHLYLGLMQDLVLDIAPFPKKHLALFSAMGQDFYNPPDVSGWPGGRYWMNNGTVNVRRVLIESLFLPIDKEGLSEEEQRRLDAVMRSGNSHFSVTEERMESLARMENKKIITRLTDYFLPVQPTPQFRSSLLKHLENKSENRLALCKQVTLAVLQSPYYQLS